MFCFFAAPSLFSFHAWLHNHVKHSFSSSALLRCDSHRSRLQISCRQITRGKRHPHTIKEEECAWGGGGDIFQNRHKEEDQFTIVYKGAYCKEKQPPQGLIRACAIRHVNSRRHPKTPTIVTSTPLTHPRQHTRVK